ncbi:hypothetical protein PV396_24650 [Streptomyces sp. ME02-8801-2C]|uniref:hypothetical protein n=1 Tax=Streptomyces sp. ME02-8801-2C TaxID=3028680 RepID=UPI0029B5C0C8|nr:hypothetical protein [Streptomyces sp. ME02-8801-2C]MDX3455093.1 hypothetical protein [Streptomyces sp. ME02-8801-2C]
MSKSRRVQAAQIVERRILSLVPRAVAHATTVTVTREYELLGRPATDSWTGGVDTVAQRIALALYGTADQDEPDDLHTPLRDQLEDALRTAGQVPATMPVEVLAQAGVLADAILPVALRAARNAARKAVLQAADLFEERGRSLLDGAIMTGADAAALLRAHADAGETGTTPQRDEEEDTPADSTATSAGAASTARGEILAALIAAGHSEASALEVLTRADREPRDPDPDPDFRETLGGGHALVVEYDDCEMHASCQCGSRFGITTPDASLDTFVPAWEHHTNTEVA